MAAWDCQSKAVCYIPIPKWPEVFVRTTKIDALAIAIGNAHGIYKCQPRLGLTSLKQISESTDLSLMLHGCSGIPAPLIKDVIAMGICKINVNTEIAVGGVKAIKEMFENI